MSVDACAEIVRKGDPDRFLSAMTAPPEQRGHLMVLYAFNLEIARAALASKEPMIAEMRLQFWMDTLDDIANGKPVSSHSVAQPLADLVQQMLLPYDLLQEMIEARRFDIANAPHKNAEAFHTYIKRSSGNLMGLSVKAIGGDDSAVNVARGFGHGTGICAMLVASPVLNAANRPSLPPGDPLKVIVDVAEIGLAAIADATKQKQRVPALCAAAMRTGWQAKILLKQARNDPQRVIDGQLGLSDFNRKTRLLLKTMTGQW